MTKRIRGRASAADRAARGGAGAARSKVAGSPSDSTVRRGAGPRVLLYSHPGCTRCRQAKAFLLSQGIPFSELDVSRSQKARKALDRLGARAVPTILVGDRRLDGFSVSAFLRLYQQQRERP